MQYLVLFLLFVISPLLYGSVLTNYIIALETVILILLSITQIKKIKQYKLTDILLAVILYLTWMFGVLIIFSIEPMSIIRIIQFIGCISAFFVAATTKWRVKTIDLVARVVSVVILLMFIYWIVSGSNMSDFSLYYANPDTYCSLMFVFLAFLFFSTQRKSVISIAICFLLIVFTGARASLLAAVIFILMLYLFQSKKIVKRANLLLLIEAVALFAFVIVYPMLMTLDIGSTLDEYSHQYFGKNFFSGRQILWVELIEKIVQSPIIGYGLSADPEIVGFTKSSHNLYIQTALQSGIVGLSLLVVVLVSIYRRLVKIEENPYSILSACFIIAVLVHESLEICLTQNAIAFGFMIWFMMGLGCNLYFQKTEKKLQRKI